MPASDWFSLSFERMADSLAGRPRGPVFLVGSALTLDSPTDYDIRMPLLEHDVERLFGSAPKWFFLAGLTDARISIHGQAS